MWYQTGRGSLQFIRKVLSKVTGFLIIYIPKHPIASTQTLRDLSTKIHESISISPEMFQFLVDIVYEGKIRLYKVSGIAYSDPETCHYLSWWLSWTQSRSRKLLVECAVSIRIRTNRSEICSDHITRGGATECKRRSWYSILGSLIKRVSPVSYLGCPDVCND